MSEQMKDGYYWVKYEGEWTIAEYSGNTFAMFFCDCLCNEDQLDEIGDYIETPEKYKG